MSLDHVLALALVLTSMSGCGSPGAASSPSGVSLPAQWRESLGQSGPVAKLETTGPWWTTFGDRNLSRVIERAIESAPQVHIMRARLTRSRALAAQARAALYPHLAVEASGNRRKQVASFPASFGGMDVPIEGESLVTTFESESWNAVAVVTYEPPLFNRTRSTTRALELETSASRADLARTRLDLAGEISTTWFLALEVREQQRVLEELLEVARTTLEFVQFQFDRGAADALTVAQQRRRLASTTTQLAALEGRFAELGNQLRTLVGAEITEELLPAESTLPLIPPLPAVDSPARVLEQRPAVIAARHRLRAADRRAAAARAEWLPRLQLHGTLGYGGEQIRDTFDNFIYTGVITLTQPIYQGGRIGAERDLARAEFLERRAEHADTVRTALLDVETAVARERGLRAQASASRDEVQAAGEALTQAQMMYERGLIDFLPLLDSQEALLQARLGLVSARRELLIQRVRLHRALGGSAQTKELLRESSAQHR